MRKLTISFIAFFFLLAALYADEGMWLPLLLEGYTIEDMQDKGLQLSAGDIYSVNQSGIKDAVVIFGRGCTGEVISDQGLLLTNHHCGLSRIQAHSSVENDYIKDGFWAMSREEELPNPGLSVTFLVRMDDVTDRVLEGVQDDMGDIERQQRVSTNISALEGDVEENEGYTAVIKPLYYGNEYFMFVYEIFRDVRLVGAPPQSIGNFGRDTDNWMWPRHTCDFSLFRIYANKDNEPAEYSPDNVPYKPKKHLPVSLDGVEEGDLTFLMGYPGSTYQYLTGRELKMITEISIPHKIKVRTARMEIMQRAMDASDEVRIQYTSKYARVTNAWKKWQGMLRGLDRVDAIRQKEELEQEFIQWVQQDEEHTDRYGDLFYRFNEVYDALEELILVRDYSVEVVLAVELLNFAADITEKLNQVDPDSAEWMEEVRQDLLEKTKDFYDDYHKPADRKIFAALMQIFKEDIEPAYHPAFFKTVSEKYRADFNRYSWYLYSRSIYGQQEKLEAALSKLSKGKIRKLLNDPLAELVDDFRNAIGIPCLMAFTAEEQLQLLYRLYVKALREMQSEKTFYPDANFTMRLTYGQVAGYEPRDATYYEYYTTLAGVIEKARKDVRDYTVPPRLVALYRSKDYGRYARDSTMHVGFIARNHTSGGNSGSPVMNSSGALIGINFDRNWEGTMSDYHYDPEQCRNISVDIRYILFIIDKYAGAAHLVEEMTIL